MYSKEKEKLFFTVIAAILLFLINNIFLGSIVPRMPGGSATGITTMFVITFLGLLVRQVGFIPLLYLIYGLIGLTSHLLKGDLLYLLIIILMVITALIYDWLLCLNGYRFKAQIFLFPVFFVMTQASSIGISFILKGEEAIYNFQFNIIAIALLLGYLGIIIAFICFKIMGSKLFYKPF